MKIREKIPVSAGLVILAYIAFISLGMPDGLLGVAWPSIRKDFTRSLDSIGMILSASTAGYLISSFYGGQLLSRMGVGLLLSISCAITGLGMLGYTGAGSWWMMIPIAFIAGSGAGAIDSGINTYAAVHFSERLMQWLHASWGIGITMGPIIMTAGLNYFGSWRLGYIAAGMYQITLALVFGLTRRMWDRDSSNPNSGILHHENRTPVFETLRQTRVWLSIMLFFAYSGIEASVGTWTYTILTESRGISGALAGIWVGSYWGAFTIGRILAGIFTRKYPMGLLIKFCLLLTFLGTILLIWNPFLMSGFAGVVIIGFAIAPVFPGMVSLTGSRVSEKYMANTVGMQISAAGLGMAMIPSLSGVLAQRTSLEVIPFIILFCVITLYLLHAFTLKDKKTA